MDMEGPWGGTNRALTWTPIFFSVFTLNVANMIEVMEVHKCMPTAVRCCRREWEPFELLI